MSILPLPFFTQRGVSANERIFYFNPEGNF